MKTVKTVKTIKTAKTAKTAKTVKSKDKVIEFINRLYRFFVDKPYTYTKEYTNSKTGEKFTRKYIIDRYKLYYRGEYATHTHNYDKNILPVGKILCELGSTTEENWLQKTYDILEDDTNDYYLQDSSRNSIELPARNDFVNYVIASLSSPKDNPPLYICGENTKRKSATAETINESELKEMLGL